MPCLKKMAELRLSMTAEARTVLTDLLRLIAPAAARVAVNRANIPDTDMEVAGFWTETLSAVRLALRDLVFADITDAQLESNDELDDESLPTEKRHALACYACFGLLQQSLISQLCPEAFD